MAQKVWHHTNSLQWWVSKAVVYLEQLGRTCFGILPRMFRQVIVIEKLIILWYSFLQSVFVLHL